MMVRFSSKQPPSMRERHEEGLLNTVVRKVQSIVDYRRAHSIVPDRAPWRALRDALTAEEFSKLESMVEVGVIKAYRGINYPSYEIDYAALNSFRAEMRRLR